MRDSRTRFRRGFTLVETLAALMVGIVVAVGARMVLSGIGDAGERVGAASRTMDEEANIDRFIRHIVGNIDVEVDSAAGFGGDATRVDFTSWCATASGWMEPCRLTLAFESVAGIHALTAIQRTAPPIVLRRGFGSGALRYLQSAEHGGTWFSVWGKGTAVPLAIGFVIDQDTTIVRIGDRH